MEKEIKTASFVNENANNNQIKQMEQISQNLGKKIEKSRKSIKRKNFILMASCTTLIAAGTVFCIVKSNQRTPIHNIIREAEIHTNHGLTPDGKFISPYLDHDCVIEEGMDNYMQHNGFTDEQINEIMKQYRLLQDEKIEIHKFEEEVKNAAKK